jgi:hypothetical protein
MKKPKILKLKPLNKYKNLKESERKLVAEELLKSIRGKLVLGQACAIAYGKLRETEPSNAEDIALLGEQYFGMFYAIALSTLRITDGRNGVAK